MNVKSEGKRIFGGCLLLMMAVLTICTVAFATVTRSNDSYSLVIQKLFKVEDISEDGLKEAVLTQAQEKTYTFKIEGTVRGENGENIPYSEEITLSAKDDADPEEPGWQSKPIVFGQPYKVTVAEITDSIEIEVNDKYYNLSDSYTNAVIPVNSRTYEMELKNNSVITVSRPELEQGESDPGPLWYHVTSRPEEGHHADDFESLDMTFSLEAGKTKKIERLPSGDMLCAGMYTIEQIAAPAGYQVQMGTRTETVTAGEAGRFYINGIPGRLSLTAGGTKGDGATHYYTIDRTETEQGDDSVFVVRTVSVASGEKYVLDNLPKGGYTVKEYSLAGEANTEFSLLMPQTTQKSKIATSSAPQSTDPDVFKTFSLTKGTTYFKLNSFGPLYDSEKNTINNASIVYELDYGWGNAKGGITYVSASGGPFKAIIKPYTFNGAERYPDPNTLKIGFRTRNVSDSTAQFIGVAWTEYFEKEELKTFEEAGKQYKDGITLDKRGWLTITAPAAKEDSDTSQIVYYYTLRNSKNQLITLSDGATDKDGTTVKLAAGQSIKITGLAAGSYKITEDVDWENVGFTMEISGNPFGTTETGKEIQIQIGGKRDITISKPALGIHPDGSVDDRVYIFVVEGSNNVEKRVEVKAGESETVTLPGAGKYTVRPQNDTLEEYQLGYTDSGAIYGTVSGSMSTITFTNVLRQGAYGYRYVHEYYVKDSDGIYTYEGNSQITTRRGRRDGERYQAGQITKVTNFRDNPYKHFSDGYGRVDGIQLAEDPQMDLEEANYIVHPIASASSAQVNQGSVYPIASASSAQAKLNDGALRDLADQEPECDDTGIVNAGVGYDSEGRLLNYEPDSGWNHIDVTKDASQIVILRYYRDRKPEGKYNVIHVYYYRDENGDKWEGISGVLPQNGELGIKYTGDQVNKIYSFKPADAQQPYTYTWDSTQYGVVEENGDMGDYNPDTGEFAGDGKVYRTNDAWNEVEGTEEGNQIIILRYYREPSKEGSYNVVHEYYFREESENHDSEEEDLQRGRAAQYLNGDTEADEGDEDIPDKFTGTINRNDGYVYTFEGRTGIESVTGKLGDTCTEEDVDRKYKYGKESYHYIEAGYGTTPDPESYSSNLSQQWAAVTEEGDQIIILRYYREGEEPDEPDTPPPDIPENPTSGSYNIVHEYYLEKKDGSRQLEGVSSISTKSVSPLTQTIYKANEAMWEPRYGSHIYTHREDVYGIVIPPNGTAVEGLEDKYTFNDGTVYGRDPKKQDGVQATKSGDQIIILRYVRQEPEVPEKPAAGIYKVVHTYYLRDETGDHFEGRSGIASVKADLDGRKYTSDSVVKIPVSEATHKEYGYETSAYGYAPGNTDNDTATTQDPGDTLYKAETGKTWVEATEAGDQIIILKYVRTEPKKPDTPTGSYKVVHTYYLRDESGDHFEGRSGITTVKADLNNQRYTADSVKKIPICAANSKEYGYETSAYGYAPGDTANDTATTQDPKDTLYKAETGKTWAEATEAGDQIIILKYVRTEPKKPDTPTEPDTPDTPTTGSYKVVHTYYLRDESGDHFEGRSGIATVKADLDGRRYTADNVEKIPTSEATGREYGYETSAYGYAPGNTDHDTATTQDPGDTLYRAETGKTWVEAAETGDQIIILKYIRTEPPAPDDPEAPVTGSYKVVHMYYLRNNTGDHFEGRSGIGTVERALSNTTYTSEDVERIPTCAANQRVYVYDSCAYGHVIGDTANDQPTVQDPGDTLYQADPEMEWVRATETGDQIIILKYYRRVNSGGGRPGSGSDSGTEPGPEPTEPTPETPANPVPETPPDPTPEQPSLPDPNAPDSPDRVTITEDGVPTTYVRVWDPEAGEYIYLPEGEVPLWGIFLPKTGDMSKSPLWALLAMGSLGILWTLWSRKPGDEEDR